MIDENGLEDHRIPVSRPTQCCYSFELLISTHLCSVVDKTDSYVCECGYNHGPIRE